MNSRPRSGMNQPTRGSILAWRQLLHVSFKLAAKRGQAYLDLLDTYQEAVALNVTFNLYQRHMKPLFVGDD